MPATTMVIPAPCRVRGTLASSSSSRIRSGETITYPDGSSYSGTEGDDVVVITNGPVTFDPGLRPSSNTAAAMVKLWIEERSGHDTAVEVLRGAASNPPMLIAPAD